MTLRLATEADIPFIRSLTTRPDYAPFISDDDDARLRNFLTDPQSRLVIWQGQGAQGFAIFRELGSPSGRVELYRLALDRAGSGQGLAFLNALLDFAFRDLDATRVWFDASGENLRAMTVYERAGCRREGVQRAHWWRPALGRAVDMHLFGILRAEWAALRGGAAG